MTPQAAMVPFTLRSAPADVPSSPPGVGVYGYYEGPHGPAYIGSTDGGLVTRAWGPHLPDTRLDFGRSGRLDGKRHTSFVDAVALAAGSETGEAVRLHGAVFSRRRRGIVITVGSRSYPYRRSGYVNSRLERKDGTPVARPGAASGAGTIAEAADVIDLAVFLVMFYAVPVPE